MGDGVADAAGLGDGVVDAAGDSEAAADSAGADSIASADSCPCDAVEEAEALGDDTGLSSALAEGSALGLAGAEGDSAAPLAVGVAEAWSALLILLEEPHAANASANPTIIRLCKPLLSLLIIRR